LKQLDPNITAQRNLLCCVYEIIYSEQKIDNTLQELGLPVHPRHKEFDTIQQVVELCENPETKEILKQENIDFD
jgi:NAD-dependent DNA ligase